MTAGGRGDLAGRLEVAVEAARAAGELLVGYQQPRLTVQTKSSATDTVSEADHASEALIMGLLFTAFGDDGLLGEEAQANRDGTSGLRWVVDPLDGTVNYLHGLPAWCVSIACEDVARSQSVVAVVHHALLGETFVATEGGGARLLGPHDAADGGVPLRVSDVPTSRALVATGFGYDADRRAAQDRKLTGLVQQIGDLRRFGAAALDLTWVAAGRLDGFVEHGLGPWDRAAGTLLVMEAGGAVSRGHHTLAGQRLEGIFAGSPELVAMMLEHYDQQEPA
jgi:myo-inositol-1(or 4)-monophosphatase